MKLLKNRTVLGLLCIALSLLICFAVTPLFNASVSKKATIVRVSKEIKSGDQITTDMVQTVEVGSYNLPKNILKDKNAVVGKYAAADLEPGDLILTTKLSGQPAADNAYLYQLNGEKQAMSVAIKSFSEGLSGKLKSGDIVSVIAPDYKKQGAAVIPQELQYVEVIGVTASTGYDTDQADETNDSASSKDERELPSTVTLLVTPEQSKTLADLDSDGKLHLTLVYRGDRENAAKFLNAQDKVLEELYPKNSSTASSSSAAPSSGEGE